MASSRQSNGHVGSPAERGLPAHGPIIICRGAGPSPERATRRGKSERFASRPLGQPVLMGGPITAGGSWVVGRGNEYLVRANSDRLCVRSRGFLRLAEGPAEPPEEALALIAKTDRLELSPISGLPGHENGWQLAEQFRAGTSPMRRSSTPSARRPRQTAATPRKNSAKALYSPRRCLQAASICGMSCFRSLNLKKNKKSKHA